MLKSRMIPRVSARKADHGVILELALQGWRNSEIAARCRISEPTVKRTLAKYNNLINGLGPGDIQAYRDHRGMLFSAAERELMASLLDPEAIAKASLNNRAYAFQQIFSARRLEEGKSTENHAILSRLMGQTVRGIGKVVRQPNQSGPSPDPSDSAPTRDHEMESEPEPESEPENRGVGGG